MYLCILVNVENNYLSENISSQGVIYDFQELGMRAFRYLRDSNQISQQNNSLYQQQFAQDWLFDY
jgi:hypothetical protein